MSLTLILSCVIISKVFVRKKRIQKNTHLGVCGMKSVSYTHLGMAVNKASGMYYFYGTDVLMGVITALGAVVLVFYFLRKKPFVYLYIILAALSIFSNFLAQNGVMAAGQMVVEALLISYLLMSRRVANVYHFHTRLNAVPHYVGEPIPAPVAGLSAEQERVFADLEEIKKQHDEGSVSDEEFAERKRKLLMGL